jgi:hypothetical protein
MATITSSSTRSKRKSNKPVTTSKGRANRSSASQAKVTNSGGGKPGSAKVTTGSGGTGTKPAAKPAPKPTPKPAAKPAAKVNGQQPRAITNGRSATMRQIRAKAIQAQRQAQGKSTAASRNPGITPDSARGQRISAGAKGQRVIGDSGQVRAAQARGTQIKAQAQAKRGAKANSQAMKTKLQQAAVTRLGVKGIKGGSHLTAAAAGLQAYNTADGTLTAAKKRGDLDKRRQPSPQEKAKAKREEQTARAKNSQRKSPSFDDAFRDARRAKVKTFTWRGKQYTTEMK